MVRTAVNKCEMNYDRRSVDNKDTLRHITFIKNNQAESDMFMVQTDLSKACCKDKRHFPETLLISDVMSFLVLYSGHEPIISPSCTM